MTLEGKTGSGMSYTFLTHLALLVMLLCAGYLFAPSISYGAELKPETLKTWDAYLQAANVHSSSQTSFLWAGPSPERLQRVRGGEILVSSAGKQNPQSVPSGLIHDWVGVAFIPYAKIEDVLSVVRDYGNYKLYYKPTVVDSAFLGSSGLCDKYVMHVVNNEVVAQTALEMEYETCYFKTDEQRWYSITRTSRVQEIRNYGQANERKLPPNQGSGYLWRLYSVAKFERRDGGTYIEIEAIALSRDIPTAVRWLVTPIVRRVSMNSLLVSLQQTRQAVRSTEYTNRMAKAPATDDNRWGGAFAAEAPATIRSIPAGKP
jgi:hypothetical protein